MSAGVSSTLLQNSQAVDPSLLKATAPSGNQKIDQQQFLTLFLAQLQNQDPLSPMQPDQLTAQLAQFSSLEQLTGINTRLDTLTGASKQEGTSALLGLIGKEVTFDGGALTVKDGQASPVTYKLTDAADKVTATIKGSDGTVLRTIDLGAQGVGDHTFQFDGRDASGQLVANGTYTLEVSSQAGSAAPTAVSLVTSALVDGVDLSSDPPALLVGGQRVTIDKVQQVHQPDQS
jgi:flagellar basal-body rod modification protein FlgD